MWSASYGKRQSSEQQEGRTLSLRSDWICCRSAVAFFSSADMTTARFWRYVGFDCGFIALVLDAYGSEAWSARGTLSGLKRRVVRSMG